MNTKAIQRPCLICGKPCAPTDRNTDGTHAHPHCLRTRSWGYRNPAPETPPATTQPQLQAAP